MEEIFDRLGQFIKSPLCAFEFRATDYPTQFQQHLITSYCALSELVQTQSTDDIVRLFHSSDKPLQIFVPGVLYEMLLDPASAQAHFETYMPSLRSQSWTHFGRLLLSLLRDSFLWVKQQCRAGVIPSLEKLFLYGQLDGDLIVLAVKTIDYTDLSQGALNYSNQLLCFFHRLLTEPVDAKFGYILAKTLFYKIFRMLALLACIEDQALRQYKMRLVLVAERLFEVEREKCLYIANSGINVLRQAEKEELLAPLSAQILEALRVWEAAAEPPQTAATRLASVLPLRVQTTLLFIMREKPSRLQVKVQLQWVFGSAPQYSALLVMDILRYLLALPSEEFPLREGLDIIEWLFYRVAPNNLLAELWKDELFYPCFAEQRPFPAAPQRALRFTGHLLQTDPDLGQTLIIYLLHHYRQNHASTLRLLLMQANETNILNIDELLNGQALRGRTKEELQEVLGHMSTPSFVRAVSNSSEPLYYDPLESMNRRDSQMSMEFSNSDQSLQYAQESDPQQNAEILNANRPSEEPVLVARVKLDKMFVQDMGKNLNDLLVNPSLPLFRQLLKQLVRVLKEMHVEGEKIHSDSFITQTAKVTYLMFQNQFQEHTNLPPKEQSIIFELLNCIASEWKSRGFQLDVYKKLVKRIVQLFPTTEPSFWRYFLLNFRRSNFGSCREMREWLISKEQAQFALALLSELGPISRQLIENGEQLKLTFP